MMRKRMMVLFFLSPMVFGLSACGGGAKDDGVASGGGTATSAAPAAPNAQVNPRDAQLKFAQCMRQNGVNMPDPQPGQPARIPDANGDQAKLEAATKKCQPLLQQGGGQINPSDPKFRDALVKFAKCMRQHGVDMPDPGPDGRMQIPSGAQAKLQAAQQQCNQLLPGGGPGGPR
jgi:hypothetical protein